MPQSKILFLLMAATLLWTGILSAQTIDVALPDAVGTPGSSIVISLKVGDVTGRGILAYQALISFDENILNATGASSSGTVSGAFGPPVVNVSIDGQITVGGFGTTPLSGSGVLVELIFDVIGQAGETTGLVFQNFSFNSGDPAADTTNGRLVILSPTEVDAQNQLPEKIILSQNYPNPFNPMTAISFEIPPGLESQIKLQIFNMQGQLVKTLADGFFPQRKHIVTWNSTDSLGKPVASGFYIYQISSADFILVRKMLLMK